MSYHPPQRHAPKPAKKSNTKTILLVIGGLVVLGGIGMCGFLGFVMLYLGSGKTEQLSQQDRQVVLNVDDLALWLDGFEPDHSLESFKKTRYFDDSYEIEYEYDDPSEDAPYLSSSVTIERRATDTISSYAGMRGGVRVGTMFGDVQVEFKNRDDLMKWGDASEFAILTSEGEPFGNMFIARKGNKIFFVLFGGIYYDDADSIRELLMPVLNRLDRYSE